MPPIAQQISPDGLSPAEFEAKRRRPEAIEKGTFNVPTQGFGGGGFTMYLPSPVAKSTYVIQGGRSVLQTLASCMDDPKIAEARDRIIRESVKVAPGVLRIPLAFMDYACAVLLVNYNLSDADMTFLLSGLKWHNALVVHAFGGQDTLDAVARLTPQRQLVPARRPDPVPAGPCRVPPAGWICSRPAGHDGPCAATRVRRPWLSRLLRRA